MQHHVSGFCVLCHPGTLPSLLLRLRLCALPIACCNPPRCYLRRFCRKPSKLSCPTRSGGSTNAFCRHPLLERSLFHCWLYYLGLTLIFTQVCNWSFSLFYLFAELWGSVVLSVLFWGQANAIMNVTEAKKYYPLFGMSANVALLIAGQVG